MACQMQYFLTFLRTHHPDKLVGVSRDLREGAERGCGNGRKKRHLLCGWCWEYWVYRGKLEAEQNTCTREYGEDKLEREWQQMHHPEVVQLVSRSPSRATVAPSRPSVPQERPPTLPAAAAASARASPASSRRPPARPSPSRSPTPVWRRPSPAGAAAAVPQREQEQAERPRPSKAPPRRRSRSRRRRRRDPDALASRLPNPYVAPSATMQFTTMSTGMNQQGREATHREMQEGAEAAAAIAYASFVGGFGRGVSAGLHRGVPVVAPMAPAPERAVAAPPPPAAAAGARLRRRPPSVNPDDL